jgi:DNA replication protein DnaC
MIEQTLKKLSDMRLYAMAEKLKEFHQSAKLSAIEPLEMITYMVDSEHDKRKQNRIARLTKNAHFKLPAACIQDLKFGTQRNLLKEKMYDIINGNFIENNQNALVSGATGVGKTYLACAIGNMACTKGMSTLYFRVSRFLEYGYQEQALGNYLKFIEKIGKVKLLILDDLGPDIMSSQQRNMFMEIIEERYLTSSTIIASQLPMEQWHAVFGEESIADAICDRIFHNAYKIELGGDSMRKN